VFVSRKPRGCGADRSVSAASARHFIELTLLPMMMRALFGERLTALRAETAPHVAQTVAFFLAACRQEELARARGRR